MAIPPSLVYCIDTAKVTGDTGGEIMTARMEHIGESAVGAHELLRGRADEEEQTGTDEAESLLEEELGGGPRAADEVIKQARRLGISDKQLRRARSRLGVESAKTGFKGGWEWSLTKAPLPRRPSSHREEGHLGRLRDQERDCAPSEAPKAPLLGEGRLGPSSMCSCSPPPKRLPGEQRCRYCGEPLKGAA